MSVWIPLWLRKLAAPPHFYCIAGKLRRWSGRLAVLLGIIALYGALLLAPTDYRQGDAYRIIFVHVPSAWMSLFIYILMGGTALLGLIWRIKLAELATIASAPIGAAFTLITLITGSLWGKRMWGTWWTWDARLSSELILLFLYLGVIALYHSFCNARQGARAASFLTLIGLINVPIVHFSVQWWHTLHQGSTINLFGPSYISASMLWPLLTMTLATKAYYLASLCGRMRKQLLWQERGKHWARRIIAMGE